MNKQFRQINVFISCPNDVKKEKQIVRDVCDSISNGLKKRKIEIKPIDWEKDIIHLITGESAQTVINNQIGEYDIYVGILWKRFGEKQENGLTPTEEEFSDALIRMKKTGKPIIKFYFKVENFYPNNEDDCNQILEIIKFKEKVKHLGLYDEFETCVEFKNESQFTYNINESLIYIIDNFDDLTFKKSQIDKIKIQKNDNYIPRLVINADEHTNVSYLLRKSDKYDNINSILLKNNKIVLLGDSGIGKTTELKQIACSYSREDSPLYPIFIELNKYTNNTIVDLLPEEWENVPENQLLIILDGLDEIESKNKNDAIRQIELFSEQHPFSHIVVSCRTNFYKSETDQTTGTLEGFSSFILLDLDKNGIDQFLKKRIDDQKNLFYQSIQKNNLNDLIKNPFYLITLIELYELEGSLPESKSEIFNRILTERIKLDEKHFRTTIELNDNRKIIINNLERIAIGMETLGRNFISNDELEQFLPDLKLRDLLKYCTAYKRKDGDEFTWQFEHNNIQEYLAAKVLSTKPLEIIKEFVSFKPNFNKIIPSWVNTLSFLFSISKNPDLVNWIMDIEPETVIKFEHDKINLDDRIKIFKKIFAHYKEKKIWIDKDKYDLSELAQFGQSEETIDYLLNEIESDSHFTTPYNAVELIGNMEIPTTIKERTSTLLFDCAINSNYENIQFNSLFTLSDLQLNSKKIINRVLKNLHSSDNDWVRSGLYYLLYNSEYLNENINIFLEGLQYVGYQSSASRSASRLGDEHFHLTRGLLKVKEPFAIKKMLIYFKNNPTDLHEAFYNKDMNIFAENTAIAYSKDSSILDTAIDLITILIDHFYQEEVKYFMNFFDITDTRLEAVKIVFNQKHDKRDKLLILSNLVDEKCIDYLLEQYEQNNFLNDDARIFQNYIRSKDNDLFSYYNKLINEKSGNIFQIKQQRDYVTERKLRKERDIELLFDKQAFKEEIRLIFETEKKQLFSNRELLEFQTKNWDNPNISDLVLYTLLGFEEKENITIKSCMENIDKWNWEWFTISKIYNYFSNDDEFTLSDDKRQWVEEWCYANVEKVNFKTSLVEKTNKRMEIKRKPIYLYYFMRKFNLKYPNEILLDMISFDSIDSGWVGIQYLEDLLKHADMTERILQNLKEGINNYIVLKNHIDYCKRHKIKDVLPYALKVIANDKIEIEVRRLALETVGELSESVTEIEKVFKNIYDDLRWDVINKLIDLNSNKVQSYLLEILRNEDDEKKLKASELLIKLQNLEGLKYYSDWIEKNHKIPWSFSDKSPLLDLNTIDSIDYLIRLLRISYKDDFIQDDFHRLDSKVLNTLESIALQSDLNYNQVKKTIENFIKDNSNIEDINWLYVFLEKLERKYYVNKSQEYSIQDVIKKLSLIYD